MATNTVDHILSQINSLTSWNKTPSQVRMEDAIIANPQPFNSADVYSLQSQGYADRGDTAMANAYWALANDLDRYSKFGNYSVNTADALLNYLQENESGLQKAAWNLYNQLTWDIQNQREYIYWMFWPNGQLTQEVNRYYDDLGNYLSTEAWRQAANIAAQGVHSWASLWAIRAQQNEAYNEAFGRYIQAKEQEINAKQQIASNLINYMSTLRQEYWDTTNQYIIDLYKRANDMYNSVAQSAAQDLNQYNQLRATAGLGWSSSTTSTSLLSDTPTETTTSVAETPAPVHYTVGWTSNTNSNNNASTARLGKSFRRIIR